MINNNTYRKVNPFDHYRKFGKNSIRPDGRDFDTFREIKTSHGICNQALGSANVRSGSSHWICGVTAEIGTPSEEHPSNGCINVVVEYVGTCGVNAFENRPSIIVESSLTSSIIKSILYMNDVFDINILCIKKYIACWSLNIYLYCLDYDGNGFIDIPLKACIIALNNTKLPNIIYDNNKYILSNNDTYIQLYIINIPKSITFCYVLNEFWVVDPTADEELLGSCITFVKIKDRWIIQKPGGSPINFENLQNLQKKAELLMSNMEEKI
eukprot:GHVL01012340.1.p1 GENE.GHVL01012340.1~~GHVL01012340.1.p1  ORF type:complete len:268 (-),score=62.49 GHVL01012340.1:85-888(-)